jgi:cytochrome c-type biogenesis protein CcmH/NrfG
MGNKERERESERERERRERRERERESLLKDLPALSSGKELGVLFQDFLYVLLVFVGACVVFN